VTLVFAIFGAAIVALLLYLVILDRGYEVRRSLLMQMDARTVFDKVRDFTSWREWSPWLMHEPETKLIFSDAPDQEGGSYSWEGKRVGAGRLTHMKFDVPVRIEQQIEFIRPFKSTCKAWWEFAEYKGATRVSWCMQGKMPFYLRFMTKMTRSMIAKDYDLGLAMLRGILDETAERPLIDFIGETELPEKSGLFIPFDGAMDEMERAMEDGFPRLLAIKEMGKSAISTAPFTAYHRVDLKKMRFACDMVLPLEERPGKSELAYKSFPGGRFFTVTLQGSYRYLELAWYSAMSHIRLAKLKRDKRRPSYEVYENDPRSVAHSNQVRTTLYIPIR